MLKKFYSCMLLTVLIIAVTALAGCTLAGETIDRVRHGRSSSETGYSIYYLNPSGTGIVTMPYQLSSVSEEGIISECITALKEEPQESYSAVIKGDVVLDHFEYDRAGRSVSLYFDKEYGNLSKEEELLTRGAIVKTLTQLGNMIQYVSFYIDGEGLKGDDGELLKMTEDDFTTEITNDLERLEDARFILYFLNKDGSMLHPDEVSQRYYNYGQDSLANVIMDALLRGPVTDDCLPPLSGDIIVRSTHISDRQCTVDFNSALLGSAGENEFELTVYSIVNTLCGLSDVDTVQITVEGSTVVDEVYGVDLSEPLTARMDLVAVPEEK